MHTTIRYSLSKLFNCLLILLLFLAMLPPMKVNAVEDSIFGVPLEKFNGITNSNSRLLGTLEYYDKNENVRGYEIKYALDNYIYMYNILNVSEQLGDNKTDVIKEHVKNYNSSLKHPLIASEDQIEAEEQTNADGETKFVVTTSSSDAEARMTALVGNSSDKESTMWGEINKIRKELNIKSLDEEVGEFNTDQYEYATDNISHIRYLFTAIKEYLIEYSNGSDDDLEKTFIHTYDYVSRLGIENNITALADMNLYGETIGLDFNVSEEELMKYIGEWEEEQFSTNEKDADDGQPNLARVNLKSYSEYLLKGIAASSTYRPFETNLNNTEAISFLGDEVKMFHERFGMKRKLVMTVTKDYNTLNQGADFDMIPQVKLMRLRDIIENPKDNKIMYIDNLKYDLTDLEKAQEGIKDNNKDEQEDTTNEGLNDAVKVNDKDTGDVGWMKKLWNSAGRVSTKFDLWHKNAHPLISSFTGKINYTTSGDIIETPVFISGEVSNLRVIEKHTQDNSAIYEYSRLLLNNIVEEYWTYTAKRKLDKDLDKPLYIDLYGNILSASGFVVIPTMANPMFLKELDKNKDLGLFTFNRAFIESYPEFTIKKGEVRVKSSDDDKLALYAIPMSEDEMKEQEELSGNNYQQWLEKEEPNSTEPKVSGPSNAEEGEVSDVVETLNEDISIFPGIKVVVSNASKYSEPQTTTPVRDLRPIANKFNNNYEAVKSLDVFSFAQNSGSRIESYYGLRDNMEKLSINNRQLMINEYTVKLSYDEGGSELITFKDYPDSDEIKRFMYITNLEYLSEIDNAEFVDKKRLSKQHNKALKQVVFNGVSDVNVLNNAVPDIINTYFQEWRNFNLDKANDRYSNSLEGDKDNNILYMKSIEEIEGVKKALPIVYKILLFIAIVAIIINIILSVIVSQGKLKQVVKVFTVLYVITFLFTTMGAVNEWAINKPIKKLFQDETIFWTVVEQEKELNNSVILKEGQLQNKEDTYGSSVKLFRVSYKYPYQLVATPTSESTTLEEFYEHYLNNDNVFQHQNNLMYMDGSHVTINTKDIFASSAVVEDMNDVFKRLDHQIYTNPELAYYMPYYMLIDNMVYNLNALTDFSKRVPSDKIYSNGDKKTKGRIHEYINSTMFLDYEEFLARANKASSHADAVSEELSKAEIEAVIEMYGEENDFLGIRKILGQVQGEALNPFTQEGIEKVQQTGWYPHTPEIISESEMRTMNRKALKVNNKVKKFMLELTEVSEHVADEHLIKTIALYASLVFNDEFGYLATNKGPTAIELNNVPIERLMMGLTMPRKKLADVSITSYPTQLLEQEGYFGLLMGSLNDFLIIAINFIKPFIVTMIWCMTATVIFIRKVIVPSSRNSSVLGSIKLMLFLILSSLAYALALYFSIKLVNWTTWTLASQTLVLLSNIVYLGFFAYLVYAVVVDFWNLGNAVLFKGLEKTVRTLGNSVIGGLKTVPIVGTVFGKNLERVHKSVDKFADELGERSEQELKGPNWKSFTGRGNLLSKAQQNEVLDRDTNYNERLNNLENTFGTNVAVDEAQLSFLQRATGSKSRDMKDLQQQYELINRTGNGNGGSGYNPKDEYRTSLGATGGVDTNEVIKASRYAKPFGEGEELNVPFTGNSRPTNTRSEDSPVVNKYQNKFNNNSQNENQEREYNKEMDYFERR